MLPPLPPNPKIHIDSELLVLMNQADNSLLKLNGALSVLDEAEFIFKLLEISESIENLSIDDNNISMLDYYSNLIASENQKNIRVDNIISAVKLGQKLLKDVGSASHILKAVHKEIFKESYSENFGKFRTTNLYVGESGDAQSIKYSAPYPDEIDKLISQLENYIASNVSYPALVNAALIHAQFEMIHPFETGNGLVGRILIHLNLNWKKILPGQLLQISRILRSRRLEYFDRLEDIEKNNNWLGWIKFFIRSINDSGALTLKIIKDASHLKNGVYKKCLSDVPNSINAIQMFESVFNNPVLTSTSIINELSLNKQTASVLINKFVANSFLEEITGQQRNRIYANKQLLNILSQ